MLRLKPRQRAALSATLRELANLAAAALILGQFAGARPLSWWLLLTGAVLWAALVSFRGTTDRRAVMVNALVLMGMLTVAAGIFVLLDWLGRRKDRTHPAARQ